MSTTNHTSEESGVWVSPTEAATRLGVHGRTIERRVAAGTMRSRRDAGGRVEVFVPGEPEGHAEGQGSQRVEEPDRQLVLGATAMRALQGGIVEARADLAAARRMGMAGWIAATVVLVGASGTLVWGSWQWASERGALDLLAAEARAKAEAAERLADHLDSTVDELRPSTPGSRLPSTSRPGLRLLSPKPTSVVMHFGTISPPPSPLPRLPDRTPDRLSDRLPGSARRLSGSGSRSKHPKGPLPGTCPTPRPAPKTGSDPFGGGENRLREC